METKDLDDDWNFKSTGSILAPLGLCLLIMLTYIILGSIMFVKLESWPFLDCCYFCFMSLSTINLTDIIIFKKNIKNTTVWLCSIYILTGLALSAMCFNILHEELLKRLKQQLMSGLTAKKSSTTKKTPNSIAEETGPDLYSSSWHKDIESDGKMALECEIVAIKHKNNVDVVKSAETEIMRNSTFKSADCSVGPVFTLPQTTDNPIPK